MKIGDEVYIRGYVDEIRNDAIIIRNKGGYFGTVLEEVVLSAEPERKTGHWVEIGDEPYDEWECDMCGFVIDGSGCIDPEEYKDVYKFCPNCGSYNGGEQA